MINNTIFIFSVFLFLIIEVFFCMTAKLNIETLEALYNVQHIRLQYPTHIPTPTCIIRMVGGMVERYETNDEMV